jgi:hypothetical protein
MASHRGFCGVTGTPRGVWFAFVNTPADLPGRDLQTGDRVRFRESAIGAIGVIVEQIAEHHMRVRWDGITHTTVHHRMSLEPVQLD